MDGQIRAILQKAGVRTPLDDDDLLAIASSASSASGLSSQSNGFKSPAGLSLSVNEGGGSSSADLSLASEVLRTLRTPQNQRPVELLHHRFDAQSNGPAGLSDAVRRE